MAVGENISTAVSEAVSGTTAGTASEVVSEASSSLEHLSIGDGALIALIGMCVVFGVLLLIMGILYLFKAIFGRNSIKQENAKKAEEKKNQAPAAAAASSASNSEEEIAAAITASVTAMNEKSDAAYRIKSIKKIVK